jgi:hypothetical protein
MITRRKAVMHNALVARVTSSIILCAGILLVFAGLSSALRFSPIGMAGSAALIAALLYAGGVWFSAPVQQIASKENVQQINSQVVLFTRDLLVASGPSHGRPVRELFPETIRAAIEEGCRDALQGRAARFVPRPGQAFTVSPVRSPEGAIVYGLLLSGQAAEAIAADVIASV